MGMKEKEQWGGQGDHISLAKEDDLSRMRH